MSFTAPIRLGLLLQVTRALAIRSPPLTSGVDHETFKDKRGIVLPASSIKGVFRTAACYAASELGLSCCSTKNPEAIDKMHNLLAKRGTSLVEVKGKKVCHVCALFGFPGYRGALVFEDAEPVPGTVTIDIYPGIEIDDYTGTVSTGKLYFIEAVNPGSLFYTSVTVTELGRELAGEPCWPFKLLLRGLDYVEAVGLGSGAARPYIYKVAAGSKEALSPREAAELSGCPDLESLFSRYWLREELKLESLEEAARRNA